MKWLVILLVLTACGSTSSTGTDGGLPFTPNTELAQEQGSTLVLIAVAKVDQGPLTCADLDGGSNSPLSGPLLSIGVGQFDGAPLGTGSYQVYLDIFTVDAGSGASVALGDFNGNFTAGAISGTLNLTSVGSTFAGNFSCEMFDPASQAAWTMSASFSAPLCAQ
jgi:hypothetical protein